VRSYICVAGLSLLLGAGLVACLGLFRERTELDRQRDQYAREYSERQRELEDGLEECIGLVDTARATVERTGSQLSTAISDLRTAKSFIEQAIKERQDLNDQLNSLRSNLLGLRDTDREGN